MNICFSILQKLYLIYKINLPNAISLAYLPVLETIGIHSPRISSDIGDVYLITVKFAHRKAAGTILWTYDKFILLCLA